MRDHGGDLGAARARFGPGEWLDLSTGINRLAYPLPPLPASCWTDLPAAAALESLKAAARHAYASAAPLAALAGAQAAIQLLPRLRAPGCARILAPTYNEHAASLAAAGWRVEEVRRPEDLAGADLAVLVNPNNPDGAARAPEELLGLLGRVGLLVVDESFADGDPALSLAPWAGRAGLLVLRSFGKFYGLAGLRLGFALGEAEDIARLVAMAGPWPVSGAAIAVGRAALLDDGWRTETAARLVRDATRLDALIPLPCIGGTILFRLYRSADAPRAQAILAEARIWSRIFPYSAHWLRLGLPGAEPEWRRLAMAAAALA